jgi:hypothetical protein
LVFLRLGMTAINTPIMRTFTVRQRESRCTIYVYMSG